MGTESSFGGEAFSFPGGETEWIAESSAHIQWRDRAGFEPASLLCP